jgi:Protein of unknown function (DUF998)
VKSAWPVLSLIALALSVLIFVTLHIVEPKMRPLERTLSEYALTPAGRRLFPLASVAVALAATFLAAGLNEHDAPLTPLVLLLVFAVALTIAGIFRTDDMDPRRGDFEISRSGAIHATSGFAAITAICVAAPWLTDTLTNTGAHHTTAAVMGWIPTAGAAIFLITIVTRDTLGTFHGLGERLGFAAFIAWLAYAATILLHP